MEDSSPCWVQNDMGERFRITLLNDILFSLYFLELFRLFVERFGV